MQSVSSRIWTRVAVSISYDDNHYTTGTIKPNQNKPHQNYFDQLVLHILHKANVFGWLSKE